MEDKSHIDTLKAMVPASVQTLLGEAFIASCALIAQYTTRLATQVFHELGFARVCEGQFQSVASLVSAAGLTARAHVPVRWLMETLAADNLVERRVDDDGVPQFRALPGFAPIDPHPILREQERLDSRCLPAYTIAALAAERYPAVLRGEVTGEAALFGPDTFDAWCAYFSNDNPLYAISNDLGAVLVTEQLKGDGHAVLEMGGGLGSGAQAVWRRLGQQGRSGCVASYRFTEISGIFLRRAQKTLRPAFPEAPFSFTKLDIDRPFAEAGVAPASCTLIYGVNVLHVAHDLAVTLSEIRNALTPDGTLVISECVRPFAGQPIYVEFVFNLLDSFRAPVLVPAWRPNGGFLTPEQWRAALEANGFGNVRFLPDLARIRDRIPAFVVAGIAADRA